MSKNYNLSISPANHLANATVSYKNGNPVVRFEIGESNRVLLPSSLSWKLSRIQRCFSRCSS